MSDDTGTPSDADPATGQATGAVADSPALRSRDADYWESQARSWQSRYDQAAAQRDALNSQVETYSAAEPDGDSNGGSLSLADIKGTIREEMMRSRVFLSEAETLRSAYPDVAALAPGLFEDPTQFDSPEAMRATVENLNESLEERWQSREAQLRQELGQPRVNVPASPVNNDRESGGVPTLEQINQMSVAEMERFERLNPGLIEQLTVSAMS